ncbi:MAG: hypothetical protein ACE5KM_09240 [Planctomycetaceae bacterium]
MHANDIAWGIEIETTLPTTDTTPIGGYHRGIPVAWLPDGWKAERDGSIRPQARGRKGCEFVGPKSRGYDGLAGVIEAVERIRERGARVNPTCGIHYALLGIMRTLQRRPKEYMGIWRLGDVLGSDYCT